MSTDDPLIGKKLGDYAIQSLLGRGGMSRVYRGYDENLERYAAVKVISGDFGTTTEEEYTRRFQSEARAIAHLRHPNIVGIYQFGRSEGIYYMAQVFLDGQDLRLLLQKYARQGQRMPVAEVLKIAADVASALDYAHTKGVIHRDIKPSNIMLENHTGRAILMDFGLALSVQEGTMGDTFGSAHYIAPEQAVSSAKAVPQSDLYALGIVIYEMLAGKVPFDDPSVMSVALKHLNELPPPVTLYNPDLPPAVEAVIMKALEKEPERRHASGKELVAELAAAFDTADTGELERRAGPPVAEMMLAPAPSTASAKPFTEDVEQPEQAEEAGRPTPAPRGAAPDDEEKVGGIAGRFARRKAKREAQDAAELTEDDLQVDNDTLGKFLDTLHDPRDIGLVGPEAKGITRPEKPAGLDEAAAESGAEASADTGVAAPDAPPRKEKKRRSRLGLLLTLLLIVIVAGGAVLFGLGDGGDDENGDGDAVSALTDSDRTGTAVALANDDAATDTPAPSDTPAPTRTPADEPSPTSDTGEPATATDDGPVANPNASPATGAPDPTDTPAPTDTAAASEPSATATATRAPTATLTPTTAPTDTPAPTDTLPATESPAPTDAAIAENPTPVEPDLHLRYRDEGNGQGSFLLTNVSGARLDITNLVFEQVRPDGVMLRYEASLWDRSGIEETPARMPVNGCFQLVSTDGTPNTAFTIPDPCQVFLGFYRTNVTRRYFWLSEEPGGTFRVYRQDDKTTLAICQIDDGECTLALSDQVAEPGESAADPGAGSADGANIRLLYDEDDFLLINTSTERLNISRLVFEQTGERARAFEASLWERPDIEGSPVSMPGGTCLQLVTSNGQALRGSTADCPDFLGFYQTAIPRRYFWLSDEPGATFVVHQEGSNRILATCAIDAGECSFELPAQ